MKKLFCLMTAALFMTGVIAQNESKTTKVRWCSYNIRCISSDDDAKGVGWDSRKERACNWVLDNKIDICGMQEVTPRQMDEVLKALPQYKYVGVGRTDGKRKGEFTPILYRKDRFIALDQGNFWLSETPDVPGSKGWDAALERVASWVKLKDKKTGQIFMAVNTHFDHRGNKARVESAKLIMKKIQEIVKDKPAAVTGDFNITSTSEAYATMVGSDFVMKDAYAVSPEHHGVHYTFNGYKKVDPAKASKIDFIFITPQIKVNRTCVPQDDLNWVLSDHNPHWADLEF
jgi:endonuclease/exonuclease/phosphatase family metal-dependent hydrolase